MPTIEERLAEWESQSPACRTTDAEREFIRAMRQAASRGVGYGWMRQVIEWEWQSVTGGMGWGPEYFQRRIDELESRPGRTEGDRPTPDEED